MSMQVFKDLVDMVSDEDTITEVNKKFQNCWLEFEFRVNVLPKGLYKMREFHGQVVYLEDTNFKNQTLNSEYVDKITIPKIERGYIGGPLGYGAIYVFQIPYRQWRKGIHDESYSFMSINNLLQGKVYSNDVKVLDVIKQLNNPVYNYDPNIKEAKSWAVNRDVAITRSIYKADDFSVFYHTTYIGGIKGKQLFLRNLAFKQEFLDSDLSWMKGLELA